MTTLVQFQLDQSEVNCGMSYVFLLNSGRFFIIDGGYFTQGEDERLYQWLCSHCSGKPEITGWFFSHAHQDHIGTFINMMEHHRKDLNIHQLIFNFQPLELPESSSGWDIISNDLATVRKFYEILDQYCGDIPILTPHTGDVYDYEELVVNVLYTHEDLTEKSTFNDYSTVIRVDTCGQKILFLGDVYNKGSAMLLRNEDHIKCDILQVSHHGFNGATTELYKAACASVALWPTADYCIPVLTKREENRYLLERSEIKEHIFSGYGTKELQLPYLCNSGE